MAALEGEPEKGKKRDYYTFDSISKFHIGFGIRNFVLGIGFFEY